MDRDIIDEAARRDYYPALIQRNAGGGTIVSWKRSFSKRSAGSSVRDLVIGNRRILSCFVENEGRASDDREEESRNETSRSLE